MGPIIPGIVCAGAVLALLRLGFPRAMKSPLGTAVAVGVSGLVVAAWQVWSLLVTVALVGVTIGYLSLATRVQPSRKKFLLGATIALLLAPLLALKYLPWALSNIAPASAYAIPEWAAPLGLSFTVFRMIGIAMDSHGLRVKVPPSRVLLMGLFVSTLASGPITTIRTFEELPQRTAARDRLGPGMRRILLGLVRKLVLADGIYEMAISPWLTRGVEHLAPHQAWLLPICLGFFVYWDFAGYSDIAIGSAQLAGYRIPENFRRPYISKSVVEFWQRWHITLSEWIRLRLMMKLIGRRASSWRLYAATILSMALCGLWHGAGLNFLVWGLWHGVGIVCVHHVRSMQRARPGGRAEKLQSEIWRLASVALTFSFVMAGWLFFFMPLHEAGQVVTRAMHWRPTLGVVVVAGVLVVGGLKASLAVESLPGLVWERWPRLARGAALAVAVAVVVYVTCLRSHAGQEFVYTQF